ncbi:MAG: orotidine-5'-phosphate decarboxylase [Candidatus Methylomirabilis oxygeniifera]|uniref:Orotidine 5'-phosphate decarboxylase n=1 Tax=Methylomirabilis oxygeniifera TaxID=671143 RepID=D5MJP1_METO1|nr:MAG: orotidine-5'-phosphate decarboxylase [Candidatus Methylomirabilis oxyfera]CBE69626.1 Orotidine 5'-phosphate decarboxylase (OMP decarboxylase) (OMPDCase) (OMPdecase) [Candidatus Methylomirabilis oxyfera]
MHKPPELIVALDVGDLASAAALVEQLYPTVTLFKVGLQLFTAEGPRAVDVVRQRGGDVFLDLKLHDIPNTVAGAVREAARLGAVMCTLHASGGRSMLQAAAQAVAGSGSAMRLLAVTVLTSLDSHGLGEIVGGTPDLAAQVVRLASLAREAGLDGAVASPHEIGVLRAALGPSMQLVIPGIRPAWAAAEDQRRVMTPQEAAVAGADYLVIGRPITAAADPVQATCRILDDLKAVAYDDSRSL